MECMALDHLVWFLEIEERLHTFQTGLQANVGTQDSLHMVHQSIIVEAP